jgi:predicted dehydrogenase
MPGKLTGRSERTGLRIAVVGIGNSGSRHVRVLRSATGVAAIAGVDQRFSKTGNAGQEIDHGVTAYSCIEDALPNVDAVIIATPPASHAPLALQAIKAGKHVLIDQPMATTTRAARHLIYAANSAGVLLMPVAFDEPLAVQDQHFIDCIINGSRPSVDGSSGLAVVQALESGQISLRELRTAALAQATPPRAVEPGHLPDGMSTR